MIDTSSIVGRLLFVLDWNIAVVIVVFFLSSVLGCQAWEWSHFIHGTGLGGAGLSWNEYGPPDFAGFFFFITGFHGFHVLSGVVFLLIIMINVASGLYVKRRNGYEMVEKIGLYWHFVDLVWVFVFTVFYLV